MSRDQHPARPFFTTADVARYCAVSNDGVLKWIKSGKMRAFTTPGGHYRVSAEEFRAFLERFDMPVHEPFFRGDGGRAVLIVDDDTGVRKVVRRLLERLDGDLRIEEAADGYEAGIKIGDLLPDLVVLDVMMPRVDGVSLCRSIRRNPSTSQIRVLAITGVPDRQLVQRMIDAGADACLPKPLSSEHFAREVYRLLRESDADGAAAAPQK